MVVVYQLSENELLLGQGLANFYKGPLDSNYGFFSSSSFFLQPF